MIGPLCERLSGGFQASSLGGNMTSLDKLASMEGWDIGEDDIGKSTIPGGSHSLELDRENTVFDKAAGAIMIEPQHDISEMEGENDLGSMDEIYDASDNGRTDDCRKQHTLVYRDKNNGGEDIKVSPASNHRDQKRLIGTSCVESHSSRPEMLDTQTSNAVEKKDACGEDRSHNSKGYMHGRDIIRTTESMEWLPRATAWEVSPGQRSRGQYLQSLRKRGLLGIIKAGGDDNAAITKLTSLLRAEEERRERERRGREEAEKETRIAYASLEVESKRVFSLESRIRLLTTQQTHPPCSSVVRLLTTDHPKRALSLSPLNRQRAVAQPAATMNAVESQAQMESITNAVSTARDEARVAMDTVEGFVCLNRKLMDELRRAIKARDDLLEELDQERCMREESEIKEIVRAGLAEAVAENNEMQAQLSLTFHTDRMKQARCKQARKEAQELVALHSRREIEYQSAIQNLFQDCSRLQEVVSSLEIQLQDEHVARAARTNEEAERANMGFEEIVSIRARLARRAKHRGRGSSADIHSKMAKQTAYGGSNGSYDNGSGKLEIRYRRPEGQNTAKGIPILMEGDQKRQVASKNRGTCVSHGKRSSSRVVVIPSALQHRATRGNIEADTDRSVVRGRQHGDGRGVHVNSVSSVGLRMSSGVGTEGGWLAVESMAIERVKAFRGNSPLSSKRSSSVRGTSDTEKNHDDGRDEVWKSAASRCEAIGQFRDISVKDEMVEDANASPRSRSPLNKLARMLSSSWLYILTRATAESSTNGGGDVDPYADASVPRALIRHVIQKCGLVQSTGSGPTIAQLDVKLQRLAAGDDRLGHGKYFDLMLSLAEARFAGEPKDVVLEKLSSILLPLAREVDLYLGLYARQQKMTTPPKESSTRTGMGNSKTSLRSEDKETPLTRMVFDQVLAGAELVLEKNCRALKKIFANYSTGFLCSPDASGVRGQQRLPFASLMYFCKDFELIPGLISPEIAHRVYVRLAYPLEAYLTPKMIAIKEGSHERQGYLASVGAAAEGFGLDTKKWMAWLGLVAVGCTWFDNQRGLYNTPAKKMLGLLQWMDGSAGKARMGSKRGTAIVPSFNLTFPTGGAQTMQ